jgi:hypothetical protein
VADGPGNLDPDALAPPPCVTPPWSTSGVVTQALKEAIDALASADSFEIDDGPSVVELERQLARLDAVVSRALGAFDDSGAWGDSGARSASAWVATSCRLPKGLVRRQLRRGRQVRQLPVLAQAWSAGALSAAHVDEFISRRSPVTEAALERDQELLVRHGTSLRFDHFIRALTYWEQLADPDGTEDSAESQRSRRQTYLSASLGGMWLGQMAFDPISGAIVSGELERREHELFEADWKVAKEELGRDPKVTELCRTSSQRRADAMVEMARRSASAPANGRRPEPLFTVLVGYETLKGRIVELAQGQALAPGSLVRWLDEAQLERAVFAPGRRVEIGCRARLFTGATRRAIEVRDHECTHPYCDEPAQRCQADHIIPWSQDGPTTQENGR